MMLSGIGVQAIRPGSGAVKKAAPARPGDPNDERVVETAPVRSAPATDKDHLVDKSA